MTCPECNGAGVVFYEVVTGGPGSWRGAELSEEELECEVCNGDGMLDIEEE